MASLRICQEFSTITNSYLTETMDRQYSMIKLIKLNIVYVCVCVKFNNTFDYGCRIFNNANWWGEVRAVEFVSDIARHFRVSSMLAKDRCDT